MDPRSSRAQTPHSSTPRFPEPLTERPCLRPTAGEELLERQLPRRRRATSREGRRAPRTRRDPRSGPGGERPPGRGGRDRRTEDASAPFPRFRRCERQHPLARDAARPSGRRLRRGFGPDPRSPSSDRARRCRRLVSCRSLLEHHTERVGLSGARLPAQERMAVESAGIESEPHARRKPQLADLELGATRTRTFEPGRHFVRSRRCASARRGTGSPSPSRITPVPRTARIRTVVESCASDSLPAADSISGPSASTRARSRIWPIRDVSPSSITTYPPVRTSSPCGDNWHVK